MKLAVMSAKLKLADFLYKHSFRVYRPLYGWYKRTQDAQVIALVTRSLGEGSVVLDIGANIGFYSGIFSSLVGASGTVYCFEPDPQNFSHLQETTKTFSNVVLSAKAVGPRNETLTLYLSHRLNVDHRTYKPSAYDTEVKIEAVALDTYLPPHAKVDFIKMDIQGFEMQALAGMRTLLAENEEIKILSEFWPYGLKQAGSSATEYFNFLQENGFTCYLLERDTLQRLDHGQVALLEPKGEEFYFNIFATRHP